MTMLLISLLLGTSFGLVIFGLFRWWPQRRAKKGWEASIEREMVLSICHGLGQQIRAYFPGYFEKHENKHKLLLMKAGLFPRMEGSDIAGMQLFGAGIGCLCGYILIPDHVTMGMLAGLAAGCWWPRHWIKTRLKTRQEDLAREVPFAFDILTLAVGGGLDFTAGIKELVNNMDEGPVFEEFSAVVQDINMGASRGEALRRFAARVDVVEVRSALLGLIQSIEMGSEIVETLRRQAEQLRFNRLMNAEEAAQKAPTKMMIPMVLFILPCVFIVIFAPLALSLIQTFKGF